MSSQIRSLISVTDEGPKAQALRSLYEQLTQLIEGTCAQTDRFNDAFGRCVPQEHRLYEVRQYSLEFECLRLLYWQIQLEPKAQELWAAAAELSAHTTDNWHDSIWNAIPYSQQAEEERTKRWTDQESAFVAVTQSNVLAARDLCNLAKQLAYNTWYDQIKSRRAGVAYAGIIIGRALKQRLMFDHSECACEFFAGVNHLAEINELGEKCREVASLTAQLQQERAAFNRANSERLYLPAHGGIPSQAYLSREREWESASLRLHMLRHRLAAASVELSGCAERIMVNFKVLNEQITYWLRHLVLDHNLVYATELLKAAQATIDEIGSCTEKHFPTDKNGPYLALTQLFHDRNEVGDEPREFVWGDRVEIGEKWKPGPGPYFTFAEAKRAAGSWDCEGGMCNAFVYNVRTKEFCGF